MKPLVRKAEPKDLPELARWFEKGLTRECRRDTLVKRADGSAEPFLANLLQAPGVWVVILEIDGSMAGYLIATMATERGPCPPRSRLARLLRRPAPRPLVTPIRCLWVQDVFVNRAGRKANGARILASLVAQWAKEKRIDRIAGNIYQGNIPAMAFANALGLTPLRTTYCRDITDHENFPEMPDRPQRDTP